MDKATNVLSEALAASANSTTSHLLVVNAALPEQMQREKWSLAQFKGARQLYGKANVHVYLTIDTFSQMKVVIKSYKVRTMTDFQKVQVRLIISPPLLVLRPRPIRFVRSKTCIQWPVPRIGCACLACAAQLRFRQTSDTASAPLPAQPYAAQP